MLTHESRRLSAWLIFDVGRKRCRRATLTICDERLGSFLMTATAMLDLKQKLAQLSEEERRAAAAYLLRLKHESSSGRRETSRLMREMDAGKKTRLSGLSKRRRG